MGNASWYGHVTRLLVLKSRYQSIRLRLRVSNPKGILACDPIPRIKSPAWDSPNSCSRSAKWAWDWLRSRCHRPNLDLRNGRLKERGNIGAQETRLQLQSPEFKVASVAPRPPAGPTPILLSANTNRNSENSNPGITSQDGRWDPKRAFSCTTLLIAQNACIF